MKHKLNLITLTILLFFSFNGITRAQNATETFTATHLQAAENFLIATGINTQFATLTNTIISSFGKQVPENSREGFVKVMGKFMAKYYNWDALKGDLSKIYAAEFTEDELNQLTTFYNTPVGKKYGEKMSELTQKGMLLGQQVVMAHQSELQQMMKDEMAAEKK